KRHGKVRAIGISLPSPRRRTFEGLLRWNVIDVLQLPFSLFDQSAAGLIRETATTGLAVFARSPLCHGLLAGAIDRFRTLASGDARAGRFVESDLQTAEELRRQLMARQHLRESELASSAIRWV